MLVVSDTSPLNYLVLVEAIDFLPALFTDIYIPPVVLEELAHADSPESVRAWALAPPDWLQIRSPAHVESIVGLHPGETEAISLAEELAADALLVDERKARRVATERGIPVTGTLAVLAKAISRDLLDLNKTMERLRQTNFRGPINLIEELVSQLKKG